MPPTPGLANNSLRQVVRVSIGGDTLRVKFSNAFSTSAVTMNSAQIAVSAGGDSIDVSTNKELKFNGNAQVTMNPGVEVTSDPIAFHLTPRMTLAITIYYGQTSPSVTGHPGSRTTSYIIAGNTTTNTDFSGAVTTDHWYNIRGIDVVAPSDAGCVTILGNSITDGRGSTTNLQNRWPDMFSQALLRDSSTQHVGVLNEGIGGNCVLSGGLGPTGISRFYQDLINQSGVRWIIVFEGVNDIGGVFFSSSATSVANNLISAYQTIIANAHARNIKIYGATITPFKGNSYYNQYSEQCRETVNQWIRTPGNFDACIDFDKVMRNPSDTLSMISSDNNDGLHPDSAGHRRMGESVDLSLFVETGATSVRDHPSGMPLDYALGQNYPNPFNPATTIDFSIPTRSRVHLQVFNLLGELVGEIVDGEMDAGSYHRKWVGTVSSGIYFYRIEAISLMNTSKRFIGVKKMLLLK